MVNGILRDADRQSYEDLVTPDNGRALRLVSKFYRHVDVVGRKVRLHFRGDLADKERHVDRLTLGDALRSINVGQIDVLPDHSAGSINAGRDERKRVALDLLSGQGLPVS